ncbi:MAG: class I SAM-dependent methyltransferase [Planctomycetota bacterium]
MSTSIRELRLALHQALERRQPLIESGQTEAYCMMTPRDGTPGLQLDRYGPGAVLISLGDGDAPAASDAAAMLLDELAPLGITSIYFKPFARDRSGMGGVHPDIASDPTPLAGEALPVSFPIREHGWQMEVRLYDGLSTGLFFDHRDDRRHLASRASGKRVLNTFAYTCGFSVAATLHGAVSTTSVDVSGRYLDWGKRNFALNDIDVQNTHHFPRQDVFNFLEFAHKRGFRFDMIILAPPTFAAGSKRKGIRTWSAARDYPRLVAGAAALLEPGGEIFAASCARELSKSGALPEKIIEGLGREPAWHDLPPQPIDLVGAQAQPVRHLFTPR